MKEIEISIVEANQRIDKYMSKLLVNANKSFIYKMFRKKNILLNHKKINGNEKIKAHDKIQIYFSDETYEKFTRIQKNNISNSISLDIIYEDDNILVCNKPVGLLSQPDGINDSIVNHIENYLKNQNPNMNTFKPGICNRLDRNTSGIIIAGKNIVSLQKLNKAIAEKKVKKIYHTIVKGIVTKSQVLEGYIKKNTNKNIVKINDNPPGDYIKTIYKPLEINNNGFTLLEVEIETGKTHQIRAHLSACGFPIIGDTKYGDREINQIFNKKYGLKFQLLHAYHYEIEGYNFTAKYPKLFDEIKKEIFGE